MDKGLEEILSDNESGSTTLALKLNSYLQSFSDDEEKIIEIIKLVKKSFAGFSIIDYYTDNITRLLKNKAYKHFIDSFESEVMNSPGIIYNNAKKYLIRVNRVYTLSNSKTIIDFLRLWYNDNPSLEVYISESRPANEGRIMAAALLNSGITVRFSADSAMAGLIQEADAVLTGADKILANGDLINKTGSLSAAICCRYFNKPFFVAASKFKFSNDFIFDRTGRNPAEVWQEKNAKLKIDNYYFEEIPSELINRIFSD